MWKATRITADAAEKMQINAGIIVWNFDISNPSSPKDEDIAFETTGDYSITCAPIFEDMFADVNNAPKNSKEGVRIIGWDCGLNVTSFTVTKESLALSIGAAAVTENGGIIPRKDIYDEDFKNPYWLADMVDPNKLLAVSLKYALSKNGLNYTASDMGKGKLGINLTPHVSITNPDECPMAFYILEKSDSSAQAASVEPDEE